jgi:transcriptional regulator with XRE-family HTH domain
VGTWLKERCKEEHLSTRQAAVKAGISHATISDIINGGRPSAATIVKLAEAFGKDGNQKAELKDLLLSLSGYRSERKQEGISEPMARVTDKLSHLDPEQLELVAQLASFITKAGQPGMRSARSSTGVLVLPRLRLNFYLSFDEGEPELGHFSNLPPDMQKTIIELAERYEKENGQGPDLRKADGQSSSNND